MTGPPPASLAAVQAELEAALSPAIQVAGLLGQGGMGAVFLGRDPVLKRSVVIKVLAPEVAHDPVARRRFAREAESAAAVAHPGVVAIHGVGELPGSGTAYFVMQHVEGQTLADACPPGTPLPDVRVRRLVGEIAAALAAAHARGVIHRDIKPANVMVERGSDRAVVLDFGISAAVRHDHAPGDTRLTQAGTSLGTPAYMSPEQAVGDEAGERSDIYSLGVVTFELLAGRLPFDETSPMALAAAHIKDAPPPLASLRPDLDAGLVALVARMLAKNPAERPAAAEVARALLPEAHLAIEWPPPGLERLTGQARRALGLVHLMPLSGLAFLFAAGVADALDPLAGILVLAAVGMGCAVAVTAGMLQLGMTASAAVWARTSGYPLAVALDAALDTPQADTSLLLNGSGRFAGLSTAAAWRLLARRRQGAWLSLAGALVATMVLVAWGTGWLVWPPGGSGELSLAEGLALWSPALAGLGAAAWLRRGERRFARVRTRLGGLELSRFRAAVPAPLVRGWLEAAGLGQSRPRRAGVLHLIEELLELLPTVPALLLIGIVIAGVIGRTMLLPPEAISESARRGWQREIDGELTRDPWRRLLRLAAASGVASGAVGDTAAAQAMLQAPAANPLPPAVTWEAFRLLPGRLPDSLRAAFRPAAAEAGPLARFAASGSLTPYWFAGGFDSARVGAAYPMLVTLSRRAALHAAAAALALAEGDRPRSIRRARELVGAGRVLLPEPLPQAHLTALGIVDLGARTLREIGVATGERSLVREGDDLSAAVAVRRAQFERYDARLGWRLAAAGDSLRLALATEPRLAPTDRWRALEAIVTGVCHHQGELRRGVAMERRALLAAAGTASADLPGADAWVRSLTARLDRVDAGATDAPWLLGWLRSLRRALACAELPVL